MPAKYLPAWVEDPQGRRQRLAEAKKAAAPKEVEPGDVATALGQLSGPPDPAAPEVVEARLAICDDCDQSAPKDLPVTARRCAECTCFLSTLTGRKSGVCPMGMW